MLKEWETFYFMIGSVGGGLIGLLFVVITLTAGFNPQATNRGTRYYLSPTAVDFALIMTMSAFAVAPGLPTMATATLLALAALVGLIFAIRSGWGIRGPVPDGIETPHWTDFWFYAAVPAAIHAGLAASAVALGFEQQWAQYTLAGLLLALMLVAIRNAWDLIVWIAPRSKDLAKLP